MTVTRGPGPAGRAGPLAIVLTCAGGAEGPLNVLRSLGPAGVRTAVVTEDPRSPATASRYCHRVVMAPSFTLEPERLLEIVAGIASDESERPVLFPTADPDLLALARLGERVRARCHVVAPCPELTLQLSDKRRFADLARRLKIPVPATVAPASLAEVAEACDTLRFPVVVKPSHPQAWHPAPLRAVVGPHAKALRVDSAGDLLRVAGRLAQHSLDFLVQEFIPGDDHEHVDLHAWCDAGGEPRAWFTGRKLRIFPPHAGSGCYVVSETVEPVVSLCLEALRAMRFSGVANVNLKRDPRTGLYLMLEINPRVSQWNILTTRAGVNLPLLAWRDAQGLPLPPPPAQQDGIAYVSFYNDRHAFVRYRREGLWTSGRYLRSLLRRRIVHQYVDAADPGPALRLFGDRIVARLQRLLRAR